MCIRDRYSHTAAEILPEGTKCKKCGCTEFEKEKDIVQKARDRIEDNQRDYFLREQKKIIEEELVEDDNPSAEAESYAERIYALCLAEESENALIKECKKLMRMPDGSQEASVIRTYLDTVLDLPWNTATKDKISVTKLRNCLLYTSVTLFVMKPTSKTLRAELFLTM